MMASSCFMSVVAVLTLMVCSAHAQTSNDIFMPPSVTMKEPELITKSPLNSFNLICRATGSPVPTISWYKDDTPVENSMMSKISVDGTLAIIMMDQYKGKYQCKAENGFGVSQSNLTQVDMAFLNDFDANPPVLQPTTVNEGDPLKLTCAYSDPFSNPTPAWSWVLQDTIVGTTPVQNSVSLNGRLSVDDRGALYFQHVLRSDNPEQWYHLCEAWNPIMNIKKIGSPHQIKINPGTLTESPPVIVYQNGQGGNIEVIEGETINMYCIFKGYPQVNVIWEKTGSSPKPFFKYQSGKTRAMLEDSKNTDQFEGEYKCTGFQKDRQARVSATFKVSVLQKPKFIEGPVNVNVTENGEVSFTCRAMAEPAAQIEWFVNGKPLNQLPFDARRKVAGDTFVFTGLRRGQNPQDSDLQVVTCMARNYRSDGTEVARSYMDGYINVVLAMKYVTPPQNHTISDSSLNVILDCEISSDPSKVPTVSWHRNKAPINYEKEVYEMAPNNSLIIFTRNFDNLDEVKGEYMCVGRTRAPAQHLEATAWVDVKEGVVPVAPIASASINLWWIGLILVLLILLLIFLLICCLIRRNTGESYPVDEVERKMGNNPEKDLIDQGFHDYQRKEKNPIGGSRASLDSSIKPLDSDDDSMLEYGDIDPGKFNEDGSFIGQYANYDRNKQADSQV